MAFNPLHALDAADSGILDALGGLVSKPLIPRAVGVNAQVCDSERGLRQVGGGCSDAESDADLARLTAELNNLPLPEGLLRRMKAGVN